MNASVSVLPREVEVQSKIRKIRAFGRSARVVCSVLFSFGFVGSGILLLLVTLVAVFVPARENFWDDGDLHDVMRTVLTPLQFNVWVICLLGAVFGVWLGVLRQLEHLFGNLAAGAIYTAENVGRVRNVGLLCLLWASLSIVLPATQLVALRSIDAPPPIDLDSIFPSLSELFTSFALPGLILLMSWIVDVGLYEKEHADALQRDADLVI